MCGWLELIAVEEHFLHFSCVMMKDIQKMPQLNLSSAISIPFVSFFSMTHDVYFYLLMYSCNKNFLDVLYTKMQTQHEEYLHLETRMKI